MISWVQHINNDNWDEWDKNQIYLVRWKLARCITLNIFSEINRFKSATLYMYKVENKRGQWISWLKNVEQLSEITSVSSLKAAVGQTSEWSPTSSKDMAPAEAEYYTISFLQILFLKNMGRPWINLDNVPVKKKH